MDPPPLEQHAELHAEEDAGTQVISTKNTLLALHAPWETGTSKKLPLQPGKPRLRLVLEHGGQQVKAEQLC